MLVQEERKACGEFGGAEIKDCETENMATLCHRHGSSSFNSDTVEIIGARWRRRLVWKEKRCVSLQRQDKIKRRNNV